MPETGVRVVIVKCPVPGCGFAGLETTVARHEIDQHSPKPVVRPKRLILPTPNIQVKKCQHCGSSILLKRLKKHEKRCPGRKPRISSGFKVKIPLSETQAPASSFFGDQLRKRLIESGIITPALEVPGNAKTTSAHVGKTRPAGRSRIGLTEGRDITIRCPVPGCQANLLKENYANQVRKVHNIHLKKLSISRARKKGPTQGHDDTARQAGNFISELHTARPNRIDATKGYAHAYREQGKFGSHPMHDGFGDDDGPS